MAIIGNIPPINFAVTIVNIKVKDTTNPIGTETLSTTIVFMKQTTLITTETISATLNSLKNTFSQSFVLISPVASPRIISVDDCDPEFPPVSIIIGINAVSIIACPN